MCNRVAEPHRDGVSGVEKIGKIGKIEKAKKLRKCWKGWKVATNSPKVESLRTLSNQHNGLEE